MCRKLILDSVLCERRSGRMNARLAGNDGYVRAGRVEAVVGRGIGVVVVVVVVVESGNLVT